MVLQQLGFDTRNGLLEITPEQQTYQKEHETQHFRVKHTLILDHIDGNFREFNYVIDNQIRFRKNVGTIQARNKNTPNKRKKNEKQKVSFKHVQNKAQEYFKEFLNDLT